jgi:DNA-binding IclR family transcriptional regulator
MTTMLETNKVKIAKRVIEVFEYFDEEHPHATVMDIARRYGRPQSSTSELLSSLVAMGFLYKDRHRRAYTPTARVAMLGAGVQPELLRDRTLLSRMGTLAKSTNCCVSLLGMVGTHVQIYRWVKSASWPGKPLASGTSAPLSESVGGMLLLAAQPREFYRGLLWRINAEASDSRKFRYAEALDRVQRYARDGWGVGPSGFDEQADMIALLLPHTGDERPLVLALSFERSQVVNVEALLTVMRDSIQ